MKRKLICLTLSILMLLSCLLTGCSQASKNGEGEEEAVDNSAKTITMWVMTNDETDEEAMKLVNEAFTKITKAKFKTNVVIKFCTEDEYYTKLEAAIQANEDEIKLKEQHDKDLRVYLRNHKNEGTNEELEKAFYAANPQYQKFQGVDDDLDDEDAVVTEEETELNDYGIVEIKYPDPKENQVDIFYLSGQEKYMEYYEKEWLSLLGEELSTSSKKLTDYISTTLLNGVQLDGGVYAIPNNVPIGEYTYMMIDKELFDLYIHKISKVNTVLDLGTFLNDVTNYNADHEYTADSEGYVVPLASTFEDCMRMLVWYWELTYTDMSVYETYYDEERDRNYVLQNEYEIEIEVPAANEGEEPTIKKEKMLASKVVADKLYKTNEDGKYVDKDNNVLDYHYEIDNEGGWVDNGKATKYEARGAGSIYLVDENGDAVTKENDKRVVIDAETSVDSYGNTKATYDYGYNDASNFSILGSLQLDAAARTRGGINLGFNSLFTQSTYRDVLTKLMNYEFKGYYGDVQEGQRAAVSFVKGDARIKLEYEENGVYVDPTTNREYYALVAEYPEATAKELYGNMFAVYGNSANLARSMEVITYLNTNTDFRNLLQYGIEGQHYEKQEVVETNDKGVEVVKYVIKPLTSAAAAEKYGVYSMDIEKTGNCFIATPTMEMGGADAWVYAKRQNNDSLINPLLGFDFNTMTEDDDYGLDTALINEMNKLSEETWNKIMDCASMDDLKYLLENTTDGLAKSLAASAGNVKLNKATNPAYDPSMPQGADVPAEEQVADTSGSSPYTIYQNWLNQYGYAYSPVPTN
ncbi:MAG: hypothetical protein E7661_02075 [Ruminococcaceae bacterium]|nr:hypothetical protein [Oscillospiraceae bacterium]